MAHVAQDQHIFNYKARTANDAIKKPFSLGGKDEEQIEVYLKEQSQKNNSSFEKYMERHYAAFNHKINKCKLNCAQKNNSYTDIKRCYSGCDTGIKSFKRFVDQRITQMQTLLNQCVSNAHQLHGTLYESYRCYYLYNRGFPHLRSLIRQQSLYYQ